MVALFYLEQALRRNDDNFRQKLMIALGFLRKMIDMRFVAR